MGCDTKGRIKGYVRAEEIFNFIRQKWDANARLSHNTTLSLPLKECNWDYTINEHSEDDTNWHHYSSVICFKYNGEDRMVHYSYSNINTLGNLEYYAEYGLEDMVRSETTHLSLGYWGSSVEIIRTLVAQFGGGWVDENDCDDKEYYSIELNADGSIKPVQYVTMDDIYEKFGGVVVIVKKEKAV